MNVLIANSATKEILVTLEDVTTIPPKFSSEDYITVTNPSFPYTLGDYLNGSNDGVDTSIVGEDPGPPDIEYLSGNPNFISYEDNIHAVSDITHVSNMIGFSEATEYPIFDYKSGAFVMYSHEQARGVYSKMSDKYTSNYKILHNL